MVSILPIEVTRLEVTRPDLRQVAIVAGPRTHYPNKDKTVTKYRIFRDAMPAKLWYDPLKEVSA
jgi:hypothetical protein